jgi:hypothetical protein
MNLRNQKNNRAAVAKRPGSIEALEQWTELAQAMADLCEESRMVEPRYFYLERVVRKERQSMSMRWRSVGRNGSSLLFGDVRMQQVLRSLPVVLQRTYTDWEIRRLQMNDEAIRLRHAWLASLSGGALNQLTFAGQGGF